MSSGSAPHSPDAPRPWRRTPLVESALLSKIAGCRILLKLDNLQPAGSFKSRGIGNFILEHVSSLPPSHTAKPHFYTSSGGNAGLACVTASKDLGYPCTVVVPLSTLPHMIEKIKVAGASQVIQHGPTWAHADAHLREVVLPKDPGGVYVHPFDHPALWRGHASLIREIQQDFGVVDVVVCSVGGGGLFNGIMEGLDEAAAQNGGKQTHVIVVETQGAESLHKSIQANELVTLPGITSIATSLGAIRVAAKTLENGQRDNVTSLVVSDQQACRACVRFAEDERILVEPACGATLAVVYEDLLAGLTSKLGLGPESKVVLEVCGGKNIGLDLLSEWKREYC